MRYGIFSKDSSKLKERFYNLSVELKGCTIRVCNRNLVITTEHDEYYFYTLSNNVLGCRFHEVQFIDVEDFTFAEIGRCLVTERLFED